jgi:hypothetical protein
VKGLGTLSPGAAAELAVTVSLANFIGIRASRLEQHSHTQYGEHYGVVVFEGRFSLGCTILASHGVTCD